MAAKKNDADAVRSDTLVRTAHVIRGSEASLTGRRETTVKRIEATHQSLATVRERIRQENMKQSDEQRQASAAANEVVSSIREMAVTRARENKQFAMQSAPERKRALVERVQTAAQTQRSTALSQLLESAIPAERAEQQRLEREMSKVYAELLKHGANTAR